MKLTIIFITFFISIIFTTLACAQPSFNVTVEGMTTNPQGSESSKKGSIFISSSWEKYSLGLNAGELNNGKDTWKLTPYAIVRVWENTGIKLGYSWDNAGNEFLQSGLVFCWETGKLVTYLEPVNNLATSGESSGNSYLDIFGGTIYSLTPKLGIGAELWVDYFWDKEEFLSGIGPKICYKLTDKSMIYLRFMQNLDKDWKKSATEMNIGISFNF